MSKTPPNFDFGRWFVHSVEIPAQSTKASPKKKTGLGGGPDGRHSVPSLKSRVKDIFGSDESSNDEKEVKEVAKATRFHHAEKDKAERERKQEALLLNILGGDDLDLPLNPKERLPTKPNTNSTVVFATSIFASKNRDHDKVQEDSLELTRQRKTPTQRSQPPLKKLQPRLKSTLQRQQGPPKRVARPLSKATVTSSSSSGSEDNEGHLGNRDIVGIVSPTPRAFKQTEGPKLKKTAMVFDRNRAAPAHISQPADSRRAKSRPTKLSDIVLPATKRSRVRNRIYSSEDDLQSEVKSLAKGK